MDFADTIKIFSGHNRRFVSGEQSRLSMSIQQPVHGLPDTDTSLSPKSHGLQVLWQAKINSGTTRLPKGTLGYPAGGVMRHHQCPSTNPDWRLQVFLRNVGAYIPSTLLHLHQHNGLSMKPHPLSDLCSQSRACKPTLSFISYSFRLNDLDHLVMSSFRLRARIESAVPISLLCFACSRQK